MFRFLFERAALPGLLIAAILFVAILLVFSPDFGIYWRLVGWDGDVVLLDMEFFNLYGPQHVGAVLDSMAAGRYFPYLGFYLLDMLFLISYFFMLSFGIALIYGRIPVVGDGRHLLLIAPFATAFLDLLENGLIVLMALVPQVREIGAAQVTAVITTVKWTALGLTAFTIVVGLIWSLSARTRRADATSGQT